MLNKTYQVRANRQGRAEREAVRKAGGGHQVAADAALRLPWAGIFEPSFSQAWRPFALTALAAHEGPPMPCTQMSTPPAFKKPRPERSRRGGRRRVLPGQMDLFPLAELIPDAYETFEIR